jgi:hypothetical protein
VKRTVKSDKAPTAGQFIASQALKRKVLAADLFKYPGDIFNFDDSKLRDEGLLEEVKRLEKRFETNVALESLEEAFMNLDVPPVEGQRRYRWICLVSLRDELRGEEVERLKVLASEQREEIAELLDERSDGTGLLFLMCAVKGKTPTPEEIEQARQDWRARKESKEAEKRQRESAEWEKLRRRSGRAVGFQMVIDWTLPHTVQEYVDAFGQKSIYAKKVRNFLGRFAPRRNRRGRGANKPLVYPFEAGLGLYEKAITDWIDGDDVRTTILFTDIMFQLALPNAISPAGFRCREVLARLAEKFLSGKKFSVLRPLVYFVCSDETWALIHKSIRQQGIKAEQILK